MIFLSDDVLMYALVGIAVNTRNAKAAITTTTNDETIMLYIFLPIGASERHTTHKITNPMAMAVMISIVWMADVWSVCIMGNSIVGCSKYHVCSLKIIQLECRYSIHGITLSEE